VVDARLRRSLGRLLIAATALAVLLVLLPRPLATMLAGRPFHDELTLAILAVAGGVVYGGAIILLFGRGWLRAFGAGKGSVDRTPDPPTV